MCTLKCRRQSSLGQEHYGEGRLLAHPAGQRKRHDQTDARKEVGGKNLEQSLAKSLDRGEERRREEMRGDERKGKVF